MISILKLLNYVSERFIGVLVNSCNVYTCGVLYLSIMCCLKYTFFYVADGFAHRVISFLLSKLEPNQERIRMTTLNIFKHLINSCGMTDIIECVPEAIFVQRRYKTFP